MKKFLALLLIPAILLGASFKDLNPKHWAYEAVVKLAEMGIITGYPDGTFRGNEPVTRYQLAMALYRVIKYVDEKALGAPQTSAPSAPDRRIEAKISSIEKLVSDLRRRVAILEKESGKTEVGKEEIANLESMVTKALELISKNTSSLKSLERIQTDLQEEVAEMKGKVEEVSKSTARFEDEVKALEGKLGSLGRALSALEVKLKRYVDEKISGISPAESAKSTDIDYLKTVVSANAAAIDDLKKELESLKNSVRSLEIPKPEVTKRDLEDIQNRLSEVEKKFEEISGLAGKLSDLEEEIGSLKSSLEDIKGMEEELGVLKSDMRNLSSDVSSIRGNLGKLSNAVKSIESKQKVMEGDIESLKGKLESLEKENQNLKENLDSVKEEAGGIPAWGWFLMLLGALNLVIGGYALYASLSGS